MSVQKLTYVHNLNLKQQKYMMSQETFFGVTGEGPSRGSVARLAPGIAFCGYRIVRVGHSINEL
jgi:hypothetical protein